MAGSLDVLLEPWTRDPDRSGVLTDFDGTIASIVEDPEAAIAFPGATEILGRLARRYTLVGVVSGRPVEYLQRRLRMPGDDVASRLALSGLYGLERSDDGRRSVRPGAQRWATVVDGAVRDAERGVPAGVTVEHKGLTLSLHSRRVPERLAGLGSFAAELAGRTGLEVVAGKMLFELRPPVDVDKGTIVAELATGLRAVCFAGDDVGDLPAFAALGRLRAAGISTLSIAARSDESPQAVLAAADLVVDGPGGVVELLGHLER